MTRDCSTSRIHRDELLSLLDTMASRDRQMVTTRMDKIRIQDLNAVPESVELAEGTPSTGVERSQDITAPWTDEWSTPTRVLERPAVTPQQPVAAAPPPPLLSAARGISDLSLIALLCTLSLSLCAGLAWMA